MRFASIIFAASLAGAACNELDAFLALPPPLSSRSFIFSVVEDDQLTASAHAIAELDTFVVKNQPALDRATIFSVKYFDAPLEALALETGPVVFAGAAGPKRELPIARATYVATTDGHALGGWVRAELAGDPLDGRMLPCGTTQHDGGDGTCAEAGACSAGYFLQLDGNCREACDEFSMLVLDCSKYGLIFESDDLGDNARGRLGDVDGDGKLEVVVTSFDRLSVYRAEGLTLTLEDSLQLGMGGVLAAYGIGIGDADGDGASDILVGSWQDDIFQVAYRARELAVERTIPRFGYGNWMIEVLDVDGAAGNEVLVSNRYGHFHALRWDGTRYVNYFTSPLIGDPNDTTGKAGITGIGDTDGDGRLEVQTYSTQGICDVWEAGVDGFTRIFHFEMPTSGIDPANAFRGALGDVDQDGADEIFCADQYGLLHGFRFDGSGYAENFMFSLGFDPSAMAVADTDVDPAMELVVGSDAGKTIVLDLDTMETSKLAELGSGSRFVSTGDLDGDGKSELIIGYSSGILRIFRHR